MRILAALLLLWTTPAYAQQIWATWELHLGTHAPPTHFVMTVTSPTGGQLPPPMTMPYAVCTAVPTITPGSHCAPIGCPPVGSYTFVVRAQYDEGLSGPSNLATCTVTPLGGCACVTAGITPPPPPAAPPPPPVVGLPVPPPGLIPDPPPGLLPIGELPPIPLVPPLPQTAAT